MKMRVQVSAYYSKRKRELPHHAYITVSNIHFPYRYVRQKYRPNYYK